MAHQDERFIPPRQKLDQLSVVKDYAAVPRLDYRYVVDKCRLDRWMDGWMCGCHLDFASVDTVEARHWAIF